MKDQFAVSWLKYPSEFRIYSTIKAIEVEYQSIQVVDDFHIVQHLPIFEWSPAVHESAQCMLVSLSRHLIRKIGSVMFYSRGMAYYSGNQYIE